MADVGSDTVLDGSTDIAMMTNGERMMVSATGRQKFGHAWVWTGTEQATGGSGKLCSKNLDWKKHRTPDGQEYPTLPQDPELEKGGEKLTEKVLEVGIIIGSNPAMYMNSESGQNQAAKKSRSQRGVLQRHPDALRVFVQAANGRTRYFAGVLPTHGRLYVKVVKQDHVFYYEEFFQGKKPTDNNKRARGALVKRNIDQYLARGNVSDGRFAASVALTACQKIEDYSPVITSYMDNVIFKVVLLLDAFSVSEERLHLDSAIELLKNAGPEVTDEPQTAAGGILAFLDFKEPIRDEEIIMIVDGFTAGTERIKLDTAKVKAIHAVLRKKEGLAARALELAPKDLGDFLKLCCSYMPNSTIFDDHDLTSKVTLALAAANCANELCFPNAPTLSLEKVLQIHRNAKRAQGDITMPIILEVLCTMRDGVKAVHKTFTELGAKYAGVTALYVQPGTDMLYQYLPALESLIGKVKLEIDRERGADVEMADSSD